MIITVKIAPSVGVSLVEHSQFNSELSIELESFKADIKNLDSPYLRDLKIGELRTYRLGDGGVILYSLISNYVEDGRMAYVVEVQNFLSYQAWAVLTKEKWFNSNRFFLSLRKAVANADTMWFCAEIAMAISIIFILVTATILSK